MELIPYWLQTDYTECSKLYFMYGYVLVIHRLELWYGFGFSHHS